MKRVRLAVITTLAVTAAGMINSLLVPLPKGAVPLDFHVNLALSIAIVTLYVGASMCIAMGFGEFTSKLRRPYTFMFIGLSVGGVAYLELSALAFIGQLGDAIYGTLTVIPFIGSALLTFAGARMLAKTFNVRTIVTSWWFSLGVVVAVSLLLAVLPHASGATQEADFDVANALNICAIVFYGFSAYLVLVIKRQASVAFINALAWLSISLFVTSLVGGVGSTILVMLLNDSNQQLILLCALVPSAAGAALFLRSAYSFNKITESTDVQGLSVARNFFGKPLKSSTNTHTTSVDIVIYAANLASQPKEIDDILDNVRRVTSLMQQGAGATAEDNERLLQAYLKVEEYLLTKETVRLFTKDNLRQDIAQKFRLTAESTNTFWPKLNSGHAQAAPPSPSTPPLNTVAAAN